MKLKFAKICSSCTISSYCCTVFSLIDATDEGKNKESFENPGCTDTLEKDTKVQKKFTYHQDSMKRYKKQLNNKNAEVLERKISEELSECSPSVV